MSNNLFRPGTALPHTRFPLTIHMCLHELARPDDTIHPRSGQIVLSLLLPQTLTKRQLKNETAIMSGRGAVKKDRSGDRGASGKGGELPIAPAPVPHILAAMSGDTDPAAVRAMVARRPITANSITNFDEATVRQDALLTRIVVHPRYKGLVDQFLEHKRQFGSSVEKALYNADWTYEQQVARLG